MQRQPGARLILFNEVVSIKCNHRIADKEGISAAASKYEIQQEIGELHHCLK